MEMCDGTRVMNWHDRQSGLWERPKQVLKLERIPQVAMQRYFVVQARRQHQRTVDAISTSQTFLLGYVFVYLNYLLFDVLKVMLGQQHVVFLWNLPMAHSSTPPLLSPVDARLNRERSSTSLLLRWLVVLDFDHGF